MVGQKLGGWGMSFDWLHVTLSDIAEINVAKRSP